MFIAHAVQEDEGCGYTISCGEALWILDATIKEEAIKELKRIVLGKWDNDEQDFDDQCETLEKLTLFEVSEKESMPIDTWYQEAEDFKQLQKCLDNAEKDKAEYERLKAKFG